jgi:hypothetical protein
MARARPFVVIHGRSDLEMSASSNLCIQSLRYGTVIQCHHSCTIACGVHGDYSAETLLARSCLF